jgi:hypothetical protein
MGTRWKEWIILYRSDGPEEHDISAKEGELHVTLGCSVRLSDQNFWYGMVTFVILAKSGIQFAVRADG